jgi:hypothetical protein
LRCWVSAPAQELMLMMVDAGWVMPAAEEALEEH